MRVIVLALCLVFVTAGRLRAPPIIKGAVHAETTAITVKPHNEALAKLTAASKEVLTLQLAVKFEHHNRTTPATIQVVHKNGTQPSAKVAGLSSAKVVVHKNETKPPATHVVHKNGTRPAAKGFALLVLKNGTKPVTTEIADKRDTTLAVKEVELLGPNGTKPARIQVVHKNGVQPAAKVAGLSAAKAVTHKNATKPAATHIVYKNGTQPAAKGNALLALKNATKPATKEVADEKDKKLAVKEMEALLETSRKIKRFFHHQVEQNIVTQPATIQAVHKNATQPSAKVAGLSSAKADVHKNETKPLATHVVHKNGTQPAVKGFALLVLKNATKPATKEVADEKDKKLAVKEMEAFLETSRKITRKRFFHHQVEHNNGTQPATIQLVHKNGTQPSAKVAGLSSATAVVHKNETKPPATHVVHKNGTQPAAKGVALLVLKNGTKPVNTEIADKRDTMLAVTEVDLLGPLAHKNGTKHARIQVVHKNGAQPAAKVAGLSAAKAVVHKNETKPAATHDCWGLICLT